METQTTHERKIRRKYNQEFFGAMALYVAAIWLSNVFVRPMTPGAWRTVLTVSPMIPFLLLVWVIFRHIRRLDEYLRLQVLEAIAISAAITAGLTFTYGFLENVGFPRLSMFTVWPVMGASWGVLALWKRCR